MVTVETLIPRLIACGVSPRDIRGCSDADLAQVQAAAGRPLPASYFNFLALVGRGAGEFMSDLTAFFPAVLTLTEKRRAALAGVLPADAFVVADRYGKQVAFVRLSDDPEDAPVYIWTDERPKKAGKVFGSAWAFVEDELRGYEEVTSASEE